MERMRGWRARTLGCLIGIGVLLGVPVLAGAGSVTLAWDSNTELDLAGYKVYIGKLRGNYTQIVDVGRVTTFTVSGLSPGGTYFFSITAYDIFANESAYSAELRAALPAAPPVLPGPEPAPEVPASHAPQPDPAPGAPGPSPAPSRTANGEGSSGVLASLLDSFRNVFSRDTSSTALVGPSETPSGSTASAGGTQGTAGTGGAEGRLRSAWERGIEAERLHEVGRTLYAQGRIEQAIPELEQAVQVWVALPVSEEAGVAAHDLAVAYFAVERYDEAVRAYQRALAVSRQLGRRELEAQVLDHMGRAYEGLGDYSSADGAYRASFDVWEALGERAEMAAVLEHRGGAQEAGGQYAAALESYRSSLALFQDLLDHNKLNEPEKLDKLKAAIAQGENESAGSTGVNQVQQVRVQEVQEVQPTK